MTRGNLYIMALIILVSNALSYSAAYGQEIRTQYVTLVYTGEKDLRQFDAQVSVRSLPRLMNIHSDMPEAEKAGLKLDVIVERVEAILHIFPGRLNFTVVLLPDSKDVQDVYMSKYGGSPDYVAFYSPREDTVYISVDDVNISVLAHELTHVVVSHYFSQPPPAVIQELVAQYVDSRISD